MQGTIFDVQHMSFVDGPGIRTTVFFKGCNLRCAWCHNPESQEAAPQLLYYANKCTGCGRCAAACEIGAVSDGGRRTDRKLCTACGKCAELCPAAARKIAGRQASVSELMEEIRLDKAFYKTSGGGVTLSGGEPLLQTEFIVALAAACREEGISVAIDTAGNVPFSALEQVLPYTDIFLYDIKCITPETHLRGTGCENRRILENVQRLSRETDVSLIIRTPVIPGFNEDAAEQDKIDRFVSTLRCSAHEKLPYHRLGESKRDALR